MALIQCPECKAEISDQAAFCPHCGYPLRAAPARTPVASAPRPAKKKTWVFALIALALLVLACVAYLVIQGQRPKPIVFEQADGTFSVPEAAEIKGEVLSPSDKALIDRYLRQSASEYNELVGQEEIEYKAFFRNTLKTDASRISAIQDYDPALGESAVSPVLSLMTEISIVALTASVNWGGLPRMMTVTPEHMDALRTAWLAAAEYYYNGNADPYLTLIASYESQG